eukprot:TRINITY_DN1868_c0_g2_i1.p1 TRINITY_DN1868_c0_g2~~TRINITY_DN1868_c0_g2_i1.p1  ORF type:complete len:212 (-),score=76.26 TRINITY_DN1868_c0_g2_i1:782-1417(-)
MAPNPEPAVPAAEPPPAAAAAAAAPVAAPESEHDSDATEEDAAADSEPELAADADAFYTDDDDNDGDDPDLGAAVPAPPVAHGPELAAPAAAAPADGGARDPPPSLGRLKRRRLNDDDVRFGDSNFGSACSSVFLSAQSLDAAWGALQLAQDDDATPPLAKQHIPLLVEAIKTLMPSLTAVAEKTEWLAALIEAESAGRLDEVAQLRQRSA